MPRRILNWEGKFETRKFERCEPCGKKLWPNRKTAAAVAAQDRRRTGDDIRAYRCPSGNSGFHVGHEHYAAHKARFGVT
jgi:hypothetical protein